MVPSSLIAQSGFRASNGSSGLGDCVAGETYRVASHLPVDFRTRAWMRACVGSPISHHTTARPALFIARRAPSACFPAGDKNLGALHGLPSFLLRNTTRRWKLASISPKTTNVVPALSTATWGAPASRAFGDTN